MPIVEIPRPHVQGTCDYCGQFKFLRYKVIMKKKDLHICTTCFEEQQEFKDEMKK